MEGINKIISLFLGLIVVVVFFAVVSGRINLKTKLPQLGRLQTKPTVKPTPPTGKPQPKITIRVTSESTEQVNYYKKPTLTPAQKYSKVTTIPAAGAATILIPIALASFLGGAHLRRRK